MSQTTTLPDGQQIHYVDSAGPSAAAPTVVLLHAFLTDTRMFEPQMSALGQDFRLIAVDERGHGGTPGDGPFDYWDVARDVLSLLSELAVERAAVVGTSQGGFVGMRMALMAPERVSALAVLGTSADAQDAEVAAGYVQMGEIWAAKGGTPELVETMVAICLGSHAPEPVQAAWRSAWAQVPGDRVLANTRVGARRGRRPLLEPDRRRRGQPVAAGIPRRARLRGPGQPQQPPPQHPPPADAAAGPAPAPGATDPATATAVKTRLVEPCPRGQSTGASGSFTPRRTSKRVSQVRQR